MHSFKFLLILSIFLNLFFQRCDNSKIVTTDENWPDSVYITYDDVTGVGKEEGVTRRDPSDIIKVGDIYYVYFTKVYGRSPGYWGTIWAAKSIDEGFTWEEIGEVLGTGEPGAFDSHATFTPNILFHDDTYYLYYTAVKPTPGETDFMNNSVNDFTAIGVAKSKNPEGPFTRVSSNPILTVSEDEKDFDSYRVDDAALAVKGDEFYLYYKGRAISHGNTGPLHTKMGVAISKSPEGPFIKNSNPILSRSHEVLIWRQFEGIAALASFSSTIEYAKDWKDFSSDSLGYKVENKPVAPGLFRQDLTTPEIVENPSWGIAIIHEKSPYLIRYQIHGFKNPITEK